MNKLFVFGSCMLLTVASSLYAQDTIYNGKALNIPFRKYGFSFGNSHVFNGIRINFRDSNVRHINGFNFTLMSPRDVGKNEVVNGLNLGFFPIAKVSQPITIALFGAGATRLNGFALSCLILGSDGNINGLSISGLYTMVDGTDSRINGIAFSAFGIMAQRAINGIAIAGLGIGTFNGNMNGLAISAAYNSFNGRYNGILATAGYLSSSIFNGLAIGGYANIKTMHGLSIALFNRTQHLQGVEIGLLNYAGNNPRLLRILPVMNLHLF
jgi:hypothetical protein